jgi:hypothetical protein|tara:strand:+ start:1838 stop:2194 length:357 start_codon:yes stop_codon:yes gene_type:complete
MNSKVSHIFGIDSEIKVNNNATKSPEHISRCINTLFDIIDRYQNDKPIDPRKRHMDIFEGSAVVMGLFYEEVNVNNFVRGLRNLQQNFSPEAKTIADHIVDQGLELYINSPSPDMYYN